MKNAGTPRKRVAIVFPFPSFDSVPSLCGAAELLAGRGCPVDIYTYRDAGHLPPAFRREGISVVATEIPVRGNGSLGRFLLGKVSWEFRAHAWLARFLARHGQNPYGCIVAVDPSGLVIADFLNSLLRVPVVYYSLELLPSGELVTAEDRALKERERALAGKAAFAVIQDEERAAILSRDSGVPADRILCVPNAPLGRAERKRSNFLREKHDLPPGAVIVLNAGSLAVWSCIPQLVKSTQDWPDDWVLVCHTRNDWSRENPDYVFALRCLAGRGRVVFSFHPLSREEYPELVRSADIGVAFYEPREGSTYTGDNIRHIGLSSGKLAYYLQAGLPVLVNDNPSLSNLVRTHGCGKVCPDPSDTFDSIVGILDRYEEYSGNALALFNERLEYEGRFGKVLERIERYCGA